MSDVSAADTEICRGISNDAQRLACYDRASPPYAASASVPGAAAAATQPERNFGLSIAQQRAADPAAHRDELDRLDANVGDMRRLSTGAFVLTLDNGQQWQQAEVNSRARPKKGDRVSIRRGMLGSFFLVTPDNVATRVRRLK